MQAIESSPEMFDLSSRERRFPLTGIMRKVPAENMQKRFAKCGLFEISIKEEWRSVLNTIEIKIFRFSRRITKFVKKNVS